MDEKKITIQTYGDTKIKEFIKTLSFISPYITKYELLNNNLIIYYKCHTKNEANLLNKIYDSYNRFFKNNSEIDEETICNCKQIKKFLSYDEMKNGRYLKSYNNETIGFKNEGVKLFEYFDTIFKEIAMSMGAEVEQYPVLLPIDTYKDSGYLRNSPQYGMFCCDTVEDVDYLKQLNNVEGEINNRFLGKKNYVLSPSACFHIFEDNRNKVLTQNKAVTILQSVFRNEGRLNWNQFGRLRDYHVREIVFIGDKEYVEASRMKVIDKTIEYMKKIGFSGKIVSASDYFVIPQMQKFKLIQMKEKLKYEWRLMVNNEEDIAAASYNLHGINFTNQFNIKIEGEKTVSGCVGFGIERIVMAFLAQFGLDMNLWPEEVMKYCNINTLYAIKKFI